MRSSRRLSQLQEWPKTFRYKYMLKGLQGSLLLLLTALSHVACDHISCPASLLQFVSITQYVIVQIRKYTSRHKNNTVTRQYPVRYRCTFYRYMINRQFAVTSWFFTTLHVSKCSPCTGFVSHRNRGRNKLSVWLLTATLEQWTYKTSACSLFCHSTKALNILQKFHFSWNVIHI